MYGEHCLAILVPRKVLIVLRQVGCRQMGMTWVNQSIERTYLVLLM